MMYVIADTITATQTLVMGKDTLPLKRLFSPSYRNNETVYSLAKIRQIHPSKAKNQNRILQFQDFYAKQYQKDKVRC